MKQDHTNWETFIVEWECTCVQAGIGKDELYFLLQKATNPTLQRTVATLDKPKNYDNFFAKCLECIQLAIQE